MAFGGDGVSRLPEGKTVFVAGAIANDLVEAKIVQDHKTYCNAVATRVLEESPSRVSPQCPHFGVCGGCPWQSMAYDEQLRWKRSFVVDSLQRIGKIEGAEELVGACMPSKKRLGYRNKIELVPVYSEDRKLQLGFHSAGTNDIAPVDRCLLIPKANAKLIKSITGALRFLKASDYGLKRVGIRISARTGKMQIALWTRPDQFPRKAAEDVLASAVKHSSLVRVLVKDDPKARRPVGVEVLGGEEHWIERLNNARMAVSAPSFFQVNTLGAERLIDLAMDGLAIESDDVCCDLYCGAGTFTIPMAERSDNVVAIEAASSSIRDLRRNLNMNGLDAEVIGGDAARESKGIGHVDKLVVDPPYSGMSPDLLERIGEMSPSRVAVVSCNPTTLGRDLAGMLELGYRIESVTPVDMFPQTYHIETVTVLSR